jgi:hypothetical protein
MSRFDDETVYYSTTQKTAGRMMIPVLRWRTVLRVPAGSKPTKTLLRLFRSRWRLVLWLLMISPTAPCSAACLTI